MAGWLRPSRGSGLGGTRRPSTPLAGSVFAGGLGVGSTLLTFERSLPSEHPLRGGPGPLVPVASLLLIRGLLRLRRSLPLEPSCGMRPLAFRGPGSAGP